MSFITHSAELGPQYAEFRINRALFMAVLALPSMLGLMIAVANAFFLHKDPQFTLFAAGAAGIAAVLALLSYYNAVVHAVIHQDGAEISQRFGTDRIAWRSIEWVQGVNGFRGMRLKQEGYRAFTLRPRWLELFRVGLPPSGLISIGTEDLLGAFAEGSLPYRTRSLIGKLEQGQTLTFPPLSITAQGIQTPDQMLAWADLKATLISYSDAIVWLYCTENAPSIRAIELHMSPNADVLQALIEHFNPNINDSSLIEQQLIHGVSVQSIQRSFGRRVFIGVVVLVAISLLFVVLNITIGTGFASDTTLQQRGLAALTRNDGAAAVEIYDKLLRRYPNNPASFVNRGRGYAMNAEYDKALADYTHALKLKPNYVYAIYYLGRLYHRQEQYDEAMRYYDLSEQEHVRQDLSTSSTYALTFYQRALILLEQGARESAIEQLQLSQRYARDALTIGLVRDAFASLEESP